MILNDLVYYGLALIRGEKIKSLNTLKKDEITPRKIGK
jgi:hypothetical protein